jgi:hypothetical protein
MFNLTILVAAMGYGLWLLVDRGRVSWPPTDLLAGAFTVAGCLALVGPVLLFRRAGGETRGLGELAWLTGGLMVWIFDATALMRGEARGLSWATPLSASTMGLTILAVLIAGWRTSSSGGRTWSWTNVLGWSLAILWVGLGLAALVPARALVAAAR